MSRPLLRRARYGLLGIALVIAAVATTGCTRAAMTPDGSAIYLVTQSIPGSQPPPQRLSTATLLSEPLPALSRRIQAGLIAPDGTIAYALLNNGNLVRAELPSGTEIGPSIATGIGAIDDEEALAAMSPDGATAIFGTASTRGTLYRVNLTTMTATGSVSIATTEFFATTAAFTPDGNHVLVGLNSVGPIAYGVRKVRVGDLSIAGDVIDLTITNAISLVGVVISPDGTTGFAVGRGAVVRFDVATMTVTGELSYPEVLSIQDGSLMRSPDGARLYFVTRTLPTQLHTVDLSTMRMLEARAITDLAAPNIDEFWAVLSPDGTTAFVGSGVGNAVRIPVATRRALEVNVTGSGSVRTSTGATCAPTCTETLLDYETVMLTAVPRETARFGGWGGACTGSATMCTLTMEEARSVTATFVDDPSPPANPRLRISSTKARTPNARIVFTTRLTASEAGTIGQRVVLRARVGTRAQRTLCRASKTLTKAGSTTIVCRSSPAARRLLERRSLRVSVITTLRTDDGRTRQATRHLRLIRSAPGPTPPVTG